MRALIGVMEPIVHLRRGREAERKRDAGEESCRHGGAHFTGHAAGLFSTSPVEATRFVSGVRRWKMR